MGACSIVAHRGASFDAPENTLAAFRLAWRQRADAIEGDFRLTRDGQLVCMHDASTQRTANADHQVSELTLAEFRALDAGAWKSPDFAGEQPPTLAEVLAAMLTDLTWFMIELKSGVEAIPEFHRVVRASGVDITRLRLISFDAEVVAESKRLMPELKSYWLTSYSRHGSTGTLRPTHDDVLNMLRRINADGLDSHANLAVLTQAFVDRLRRERFELHVWTVDDPEVARAATGLGVDSITTNRPGWLRQELDR